MLYVWHLVACRFKNAAFCGMFWGPNNKWNEIYCSFYVVMMSKCISLYYQLKTCNKAWPNHFTAECENVFVFLTNKIFFFHFPVSFSATYFTRQYFVFHNIQKEATAGLQPLYTHLKRCHPHLSKCHRSCSGSSLLRVQHVNLPWTELDTFVHLTTPSYPIPYQEPITTGPCDELRCLLLFY